MEFPERKLEEPELLPLPETTTMDDIFRQAAEAAKKSSTNKD